MAIPTPTHHTPSRKVKGKQTGMRGDGEKRERGRETRMERDWNGRLGNKREKQKEEGRE